MREAAIHWKEIALCRSPVGSIICAAAGGGDEKSSFAASIERYNIFNTK
jgi:hypothetical protein